MNHKCICFTRTSTTQQDVVQQTDVVYSRCLSDGYGPDNIIKIEEQESAIKLSLSERVGIQKLFAHINSDSLINAVYIFEISRLSRQQTMLFEVRDFLISHNINLICLKPEFKLLDDDGKMSPLANMAFSIFTVLSESEMTVKQERMMRGKLANKQAGKNPGGKPPFGYTTDKDKYFIIKEDEAAVVRELFERYATGRYSYKKLAAEYYSRGYFQNYRPQYAHTQLSLILSDIRYTGTNPAYPCIISEYLFTECKVVRERQNHFNKPSITKNYICRGLVHDKMSWLSLTPSGTGRYHNTECHLTISQKALDNFVWAIAKKLYSENVSNLTLEAAKLTSSITATTQKYNTSNENRKHILSKIDTLEERIIEGKISAKKTDELSARYEAELKQAEQDIMDHGSELVMLKMQLRKLKSDNTTPDFDTLDFESRLDIVHITIQSVAVERLDIKTVRAEILTNFGSTLIYELKNYTGKFRWIGTIHSQSR